MKLRRKHFARRGWGSEQTSVAVREWLSIGTALDARKTP
jgi:hypothetical protein